MISAHEFFQRLHRNTQHKRHTRRIYIQMCFNQKRVKDRKARVLKSFREVGGVGSCELVTRYTHTLTSGDYCCWCCCCWSLLLLLFRCNLIEYNSELWRIRSEAEQFLLEIQSKSLAFKLEARNFIATGKATRWLWIMNEINQNAITLHLNAITTICIMTLLMHCQVFQSMYIWMCWRFAPFVYIDTLRFLWLHFIMFADDVFLIVFYGTRVTFMLHIQCRH